LRERPLTALVHREDRIAISHAGVVDPLVFEADINALAELGLIDEYEFVVYPRRWAMAHVVRGAIEAFRLEARQPAGVRLGGSGDAV
jgi:hypothetical protein